MGASSRLPHKVEGRWRGREKQQEEKEEAAQGRQNEGGKHKNLQSNSKRVCKY